MRQDKKARTLHELDTVEIAKSRNSIDKTCLIQRFYLSIINATITGLINDKVECRKKFLTVFIIFVINEKY